MKKTRVLTVGLLAAAGLLTACSGQDQAATEDTPTTTTASAPSTSAGDGSAAPESPEPTSGAPGGGNGGATGIAPGEPDPSGSGVNCGDVKTANGKADVFAEDTAAGTVGCVEAINVISEYIEQAPTKGEGTAYSLTVDGWSCLTDTGAQGSGIIGCDKDGLAFHTQP